MSEQMEKLMEEIAPLTAYIAGRLHAWAMVQSESVTVEQNVREAQEIIVRILQAVVDGELKLPGEEWRCYVKGYIDMDANVIDVRGTDKKRADGLFIALRPTGNDGFSQRFWGGLRDRQSLVGAGKEEEK